MTLDDMKRERVYCGHCGQKMVEEPLDGGYDRKTGKRVVVPGAYWICRDYHTDAWWSRHGYERNPHDREYVARPAVARAAS